MTEQRPPPAGGAGSGAGPASRFCAACGTALPPDARFCTHCGAAQSAAAPRAPVAPPPPDDSTRVLPVARVTEREERLVPGGGPPIYLPPRPFNWTAALLVLFGLLILALGLVLFARSQDDGAGTSTTTTVPTSVPTTVTTLGTSTTLRATTTTTEVPTTTTTAATVPPPTVAPTTAPLITLTPQT